eukprot:m.89499 g.89499  ORF g.89499 m.89499 type:complete len:345 (-) comp51041_c0_seq1:68-1102(-)
MNSLPLTIQTSAAFGLSDSSIFRTTDAQMAGEEIVKTRGYVFMVLVALQFGLQPLVMKTFDNGLATTFSIVVMVELAKIVLVLLFVLIEGEQRQFAGWTLNVSLRVAAVPAVVYAIQNMLLQYSYRHLDGLTFNIVNQTKTLFAALFWYILTGLKFSQLQILALGLLFGSSVVLGGQDAPDTKQGHPELYFQSFLAVMGAAVLSGLASALSLVTLQGQKRGSFLYTLELSAYGIAALMTNVWLFDEGQRILQDGLLHGWTWASWIPVITQGLGGICSGQVMKHAGGVMRGFAIIAGLILTGLLQSYLESTPLSAETVVALPMVIAGTYLYLAYPYVDPKAAKKD